MSEQSHGNTSLIDQYVTLTPAQKTMIAGGIAGSVGKTATAPLSRLTILYQVSPIINPVTTSVSAATLTGSVHHIGDFSGNSLFTAMRQVLKSEGVLAFWKGNLTSVLHRFPYSAINFTAYELSRDALCYITNKKEHEIATPAIRFASGAISGAVACFACYPLDLVRTRLTVTTSLGAEKRGIIGTISKIIRNEGPYGLYRGLHVSLAVSVPSLAIGFGVYGTVKELIIEHDIKMLKGHDGHINPLGSMLSGALSGILSSILTFPADVVRRRMQVMGEPSAANISHSAYHESIRIFKAGGIRGMYRGIVPEILKVTPMVGITFSVYEFVADILLPGRR